MTGFNFNPFKGNDKKEEKKLQEEPKKPIAEDLEDLKNKAMGYFVDVCRKFYDNPEIDKSAVMTAISYIVNSKKSLVEVDGKLVSLIDHGSKILPVEKAVLDTMIALVRDPGVVRFIKLFLGEDLEEISFVSENDFYQFIWTKK
jgi:hypothetical protein